MIRRAEFAETALFAGLLLSAPAARAADLDSGQAVASASPAPSVSPVPRQLEWRWHRFRTWEYPVTAAALGVASYLRIAGPRPGPDWTGGVLADDWVEDHTAIQNLAKRKVVTTTTDVFFYGSMAYRLVDSAILPALVGRSPDVAFQMSMIDLESFGFVAIVLWGGQAVFGRERPYVKRCSDPGFRASETGCSPDSAEPNRSFFAGHPAVVLTAAGLTCTHHAHLPLYGGGGDGLACGIMIGAAVATGVGRLVTEEHHLSDVIVGYGVGVIGGFVMPEFLHYRIVKPGVGAGDSTRRPAVRATVAPSLGAGELGLEVRGIF